MRNASNFAKGFFMPNTKEINLGPSNSIAFGMNQNLSIT